jgi:hypothetical protein
MGFPAAAQGAGSASRPGARLLVDVGVDVMIPIPVIQNTKRERETSPEPIVSSP